MITEAQTGPQIDNWRDFQTSLRAYVSRRVEAGAVEDVVGDILLLLVRRRLFTPARCARIPLA